MSPDLTRREFVLRLAAGVGACAVAPALLGQQTKKQPPNILLITADDMNWDCPAIFGCKIPGITPNIDKLAGEGMRFQHAHVTIAVCQPSRSVLMTGRYPHRNGAEGFEPIYDEVPSLGESLRGAGYLNGILAKNSHLQPREKFCWDYYIEQDQLEHGRSPELYYQHTKTFLEQAKAAGKPFFLMANSQDPHRPFAGSDGELQQFGKHLAVSRTIKPDEVTIPGFLPDLPEVRREVAEFMTSVHRCDEIVGAVLRALGEMGFEENTLVMFLSDNGMPFPYAKTNCYLNSTRTPWIVRWPGRVKPGTEDKTNFICGIDFMPTVLEAAGLKTVEGMDGHSFLPLLGGKKLEGRDKVFTCFNVTSANNEFPMRAVQTAKYGYIYNAWSDGKREFRNESSGTPSFKGMRQSQDPKVQERVKYFQFRAPEELYDLEKDPAALTNLAADPVYARRLDEMRGLLRTNMEKTKDPILAAFKEWVADKKQVWAPDPQRDQKRRARKRAASARGRQRRADGQTSGTVPE